MDTDNNQIYKIAKYLDKYTKDGNKKGSMYLQKLNNYLHKVQHGGNGQAMDIVKQIQRMVGHVIEKHHDEEKALTDKLQKLMGPSSSKATTLGDYDGVVEELKKKIASVSSRDPISQQEQPKTYQFEMKAYNNDSELITDTGSYSNIYDRLKKKVLKVLHITDKQISYDVSTGNVSITANKKRLFLLSGKKIIEYSGLWKLFLVPVINKEDSEDSELEILKQLIEKKIEIYKERFEIGSKLNDILRNKIKMVGYRINSKTMEFDGTEKNLKYDFSIISDFAKLEEKLKENKIIDDQFILEKDESSNDVIVTCNKYNIEKSILEDRLKINKYKSRDEIDLSTEEGINRYIMSTCVENIKEIQTYIKSIIFFNLNTEAPEFYTYYKRLTEDKQNDFLENFSKIFIEINTKNEIKHKINDYLKIIPEIKDEVKSLVDIFTKELTKYFDERVSAIKQDVRLAVVELPKDGVEVSVKIYFKDVKYNIPKTEKEKALNMFADEIEKSIIQEVSPTTTKFNLVGYIVDPDTNRVVENVDNAKFEFLESHRQALEELIGSGLFTDNLDNETSFKVTDEGLCIYYSIKRNILEVSDIFLDDEYIVELVKDGADPEEKVYVRIFVKPMKEQLMNGIPLSERQVAINNLEPIIDKKIKDEVSKKSLFDIAHEPETDQEQAPKPELDPNNLETTHFDIVGYVVDPNTNRVVGRIDDAKYTFPTKEKKTVAESELLQDQYVQQLLGPLKLIGVVTTDNMYKVNKNGNVRIQLNNPVKSKEFVDKINKGVAIVVKLPNTNNSQSQSVNVNVRLFVKPMSQLNKESDPTKSAINKLVQTIDDEIRQEVREETLTQTAQSRQPVQLDPNNPITNKFDVVGFYINKQNHVIESFLPEDQKLVLSIFNDTIRSKVTQQAIQWLEPNKQARITQYKKARITFTEQLPIKEVLKSVNIDPPKQVEFKKETYFYNIYMFIVPMTYPITDTTKNKEYFEAINAIQAEEMAKIKEKMRKIAQTRQLPTSSAPKSQITLSSKPSSAQTIQPPASSSAQSILKSRQSASSAPIRRGGAFNASTGGSRGPYRHPNEEYNL
jgi:hypothetical protein